MPGLPGCTISLQDSEFVKNHPSLPEIQRNHDDCDDEHDIKKIVIGIHTGTDSIGMVHYGTLITPAIKDWINAACDEME